MIHGRKALRGGALALAWLLPLAAEASGLRLTPLRLDLSAQSRTTQISLSNLGSEAIAVQVKAFRWEQRDGVDVYEPTQDIFFAPPIVTVPAAGQTLVRFRLRGKVPHQTVGAYRIYFQEIPAGAGAPAGMAIRLRFGVPLFVAPFEPPTPRLAASLRRSADGTVGVTLANQGETHFKIHGVEVFPDTVNRADPGVPLGTVTHSEKGSNYLLPQSEHDWSLAVPAGATDPLWLRVRTDDYSGRAAPGMTGRGWWWVPVPRAPAHDAR